MLASPPFSANIFPELSTVATLVLLDINSIGRFFASSGNISTFSFLLSPLFVLFERLEVILNIHEKHSQLFR